MSPSFRFWCLLLPALLAVTCLAGCRDDKIIMPNDTESAMAPPNLGIPGGGSIEQANRAPAKLSNAGK